MVKNNYSSGRNDDRIANPNGKNEPQEFVEEGQEGVLQKDVMPCHSYSAVGNMNLNSMLVENIRSHDYFKGLSELKTFEEVVDQIYYDCKLISLWHPGTHKTQRAAGMCSGLRGVRCVAGISLTRAGQGWGCGVESLAAAQHGLSADPLLTRPPPPFSPALPQGTLVIRVACGCLLRPQPPHICFVT